jgi:decaprenyl-phosphate phosphoribosyltransferase
MLMALVRAMRPRQWVKNLLVLAVPAAGGTLFHAHVLIACGVAFVSFTFAASSIYLLNDLRDVEGDRAHPTKRNRPIASGQVSEGLARTVAIVLIVLALLVPFTLWSSEVTGDLCAVVAAYIALNIAYVWYLKHQPVLDLATVASGYVLRAVAGGIAASMYVSPWFLAVTGAGALFIVAGKRYSEIVQQGSSGASRAILREYSPEYLRSVWSMSAGATIIFYAIWAFSFVDGTHHTSAELSIVPLTLALLRYMRDIDAASAEAPEHALLRDPWLIAFGIAFALLFASHVALG